MRNRLLPVGDNEAFRLVAAGKDGIVEDNVLCFQYCHICRKMNQSISEKYIIIKRATFSPETGV